MAKFFLPLATTILLIFSLPITMADNSPVLDVNGNPLQVGTPYYVRTEVSKVGIGGGLVVESKPKQAKCPQFVGQLSVGWYQESPIMFYPSNPSLKYVHVSSDLNIVFNSTTSGCPQGAWQLSPDANSGNVLISTGGVVGNPTMQSLFKIEKLGINPDIFYRLEYCPTGSNSVKNDIMCGVIDAVDFTEDFYLGWLGLTPSGNGYFNALSFIKA